MSSLQDVKIDHLGIGKALSDGRLVVPAFQRSYAWEEEHVADLLKDLAAAIDEDAPSYFLGSVVLVLEDDSRHVADGQQRLATTAILLAAIRDHFYSVGEKTRASAIEQEFLFVLDIESEELLPRIRLNEADHDFFLKRILKPPDDPDRKAIKPTKRSHRLIENAASLAAKHVGRLA